MHLIQKLRQLRSNLSILIYDKAYNNFTLIILFNI
jgi:hypothetical protein